MNLIRLKSACLACATVLAVALLCWPLFAAHSQSAERGLNARVTPGDDFFGFANGDWLRAAPLPPGQERWGARDDIRELTRLQLLQLLDEAKTAPAGSRARKVADFRAAWLNEAAIESRGLAPMRPRLDSIEGVQDKAALTRLLGRWMRADGDPLNWGVFSSSSILGLSVEASIHGEKNYVAFLVQGGLGLPDRESYLSPEPRFETLRTRYREYIGHMIAAAGFDRAEARAASVMALETAIAQRHVPQAISANDHNADNQWTHADFTRQAPGMDWHAFFVAAGLGEQDTIVAWQPAAVAGVAELVASQPLETWKDYLRFHLLDAEADVLPHAFADEALAMRRAVTAAEPLPRAQRALVATQASMSDAIARMYAERYFSARQKARVQAIATSVKAAFVRRLERVTWMSPASRALALAKVRSLYIGIGYPDRWQDDAGLVMDSLDAIGNLRRVRDLEYRLALARLGQPADQSQWWVAPQAPNGILTFQQNAYDFSAALLQAPKFDSTASDAEAYGSIGAIIAHDITHFVDVLGADYDTTFAERHWWTAEDMAGFEAAAEPLVRQYSDYRPFPDAGVNGRLTRSENVADLAGLAAAFDAYRLGLGSRVSDRGYVHEQDRQFFLAWARSWRVRMSDAGMRAQLGSDHAPENFRIATVRNLDAWYDAFDVRPGQRLYLAPDARVRVW
jgi:putative endopeptidase